MIGTRSYPSTLVLTFLLALPLALLSAFALPGPVAAQADAFPLQPIRIIVPTQSGGMADILSRVFAQSSRSAPTPRSSWRIELAQTACSPPT